MIGFGYAERGWCVVGDTHGVGGRKIGFARGYGAAPISGEARIGR